MAPHSPPEWIWVRCAGYGVRWWDAEPVLGPRRVTRCSKCKGIYCVQMTPEGLALTELAPPTRPKRLTPATIPRAACRAAELLPRLVPPPGVLLQASGGGSGGANRWSSEATTETTRGAAELERYFAEQMAGAGWVRQAGRPDGQLAWSRWAIPAEGDWQALLLLAEWPAPGRQWLSVRVESPTLPSWGGAGGVSYFGPAPAPVPPGASAPSPAAPPLPTGTPLPVQAP